MKHLEKKINLRGGLFGSKPKVKPATLRPPAIGDFQFASSFSYVENLDLISDGPIEGLVNKKGSLLDPQNLSQGVYLNGTPVQVSNDLKVLDTEINSDFKKISSGGSEVFDTTAALASKAFFSTIENERGKSGVFIHHASDYSNKKPVQRLYNVVQGLSTFRYLATFQFSSAITGKGGLVLNGYTQIHVSSDTNNDIALVFASKPIRSEKEGGNVNIRVSQFGDTGFSSVGEVQNARSQALKTFADTNNRKLLSELLDIWDDIITYPEGHPMRVSIDRAMRINFGQNWGSQVSESNRELSFLKKIFGKLRNYDKGGAIVLFSDDFSIQSGRTITQSSVSIQPVSSTTSESPLTTKNRVVNLLIPVLDSNGLTNGSVKGIYVVLTDDTESDNVPKPKKNKAIQVGESVISFFKNLNGFKLFENPVDSLNHESTIKYNYSNVLVEERLGESSQLPFRYFNEVFIDKNINERLYGPYRLNGEVQRLRVQSGDKPEDLKKDDANFMFYTSDTDGDLLPDSEGSNDNLRDGKGTANRSFTDWNSTNSANNLDEEAVPVTHIIYNPNVEEVFITLQVDALFDTNEKDRNPESDKAIKAGDKIPAVVNFEIEVGKIEADGKEVPTDTRRYRMAAVVEGTTLIDIGNAHSTGQYSDFEYLQLVDGGSIENPVSKPFKLPPVKQTTTSSIENVSEKRYVRVTKLSTETFSILISKDVSLYKITEILKCNLRYPYSAIVGTKLDSRQFSSIPERRFDARLKRILIPSNYHPTTDDSLKEDKRYYDKKNKFDTASQNRKLIYDGDWNGTFVEGWTDNPAWIVFDLLTNPRYGFGQHISEDEVNKWELYKIGRFCDAVDDNGNFVGVPDGRGGLEPRFSCNILFNNNEKIYDAVQTISSLFRGKTFFRSAEVSFADERVKEPIALFNNINVKDGLFNYANLRRDQQFNTVEVGYLDRFEDFVPKIEVVEDAEDIRNRGVFKNRIDALGVTSKAMARRIGQHLVYRTVKENQKVAFNTGLEALLCQPGDLIIVEDELKSNKTNFGKVLSVDTSNEYLRLSSPIDSSIQTGLLTVYIPTGDSTTQELSNLASNDGERIKDVFSITGDGAIPGLGDYTGFYNFSGYLSAYSQSVCDSADDDEYIFVDYPVYTGTENKKIYYHVDDLDGADPLGKWIFASGTLLAHETDLTTTASKNEYDFYSRIVSGSTDIERNYSLFTLNNNSHSKVYFYNPSLTIGNISGSDIFSGVDNSTNGVSISDITIGSNPQIVTLQVTGLVGNVANEIGSYVSGVDLPDYLQHIKLGSPYRFEIKEASDFLYKIDSIKEDSPNDYLVSASKFDTGKYELIENNISFEPKENTYAYQVQTQVGDVTYDTLSSPQNLSLTTGLGTNANTFFISGDWDQVTNNNGYNAILNYANGSVSESSITQNTNSVKFDNIGVIGKFTLNVKTVGDNTNNTSKFFDSDYSTITSFFLYDSLSVLDRPVVTNITFS